MKMKTILATGVAAAMLTTPALADITIAHVYGKTGALEAYAAQSHNGLMLGLEYATGGTMEINGEKLVVIEKDTQLKPDIGKALLAEAYGDDEADIAVGPVSSGVALAMLPVAQEYEKILIVEPRSQTRSPAKTGTATFSAPAAIPRRTPFPTLSPLAAKA
jgi:branched-chain amino acid transport system substrate-binding protein